jgi:hypothetical protein
MDSEAIPPPEVQAHLERVLAGAMFRAADRSRRLLRFIVEQTLQGHADRLKDYTLGAEALGRGDGFDPRFDPIARVEMSRLRSRLDVYYATEGAADTVRIVVPKGGYVPKFNRRQVASPSGAASSSASAVARATASRGPSRASRWKAIGALVAAATVAALTTWWLVHPRDRSPDGSEIHLELTTPSTSDPASLAIAPDGEAIVFVASDGGASRLWMRRLSEAGARSLSGTDNASFPFWAPDGRAVGFFAEGRVKAIDLQTRLVRTLSTAPVPAGAAWNRDDVILHPLVPDSPLFRTSASGQTLEPATELADGQTGHRAPIFLPDGRQFLFYAAGRADARGIYVGELGSVRVRRLLDADAAAVLAPPRHLLYVQHSTLFAQGFDPVNATLTGKPVAVAESVAVEPGAAIAAVSASSSGTITYRTGSAGPLRQFVWFDRHGTEVSRIGDGEERGPAYGSLSPDGRRLVVQRSTAGNTDIWVVDLERGTSVRFTSGPQADIARCGHRAAIESRMPRRSRVSSNCSRNRWNRVSHDCWSTPDKPNRLPTGHVTDSTFSSARLRRRPTLTRTSGQSHSRGIGRPSP